MADTESVTPVEPPATGRRLQKGFVRDTRVQGIVPTTSEAPVSVERQLTATAPYTSADVASGRDTHYEWEDFMIQVLDRVDALELGGGGGAKAMTFAQPTPAATWSINHAFGAYPGVTIVSDTGDLLYAEVTYPDDNTTVLIFGMPYTGTAYLRG